MTTPLLRLDNLTKFYSTGENQVRALDGVSMDIYAGEFVAIMGQSGSGKSTLMNMLGCLDQPSGGTYTINGVDVGKQNSNELAKLRRGYFGFIFQRYNLLNNATAEENVEMPAIYAGTPKAARVTRAKELLKNLGLGERFHHRPSELSGGQQQRVAIARALMNNPPIILADEPTGALDSKSGTEVMALLKELNAQGRTIILITHDENVARNAHRIIQLHDGKVTDDSKIVEDDLSKATGTQSTSAEHSMLLPDVYEAVKMAFRSLRVNFFRTTLTLLGIIIGVGAVVTMLAIGNGSKQDIIDQISMMGTNLLSVRPGGENPRDRGAKTLVKEDAFAIEKMNMIDGAIPERQGSYTLRYRELDAPSIVVGTGTSMSKVRDWPVETGSFFNQWDIDNYSRVIVLGSSTAKTLFPYDKKPIGKYILVEKTPFQIIGILKSKGTTTAGSNQDETAFIPITSGIITLFGTQNLNTILIRVKDAKDLDSAQTHVNELLTRRHGSPDFTVANMATAIAMMSKTQDTLTNLLAAIAAISLLVGGIGVMNIMLVSVTERTREIGIRMATGARRRDILLQFNTEAAVVCAVGGILGIFGGVAAGLIVKSSGTSVVFTLAPAVIAFASASAVGLLFGFLPARKAAHLDPVIALATE